jgi:hypothetical protein
VIPDRIWEGSPGEAGDDADISVLTAEVETIENELQAMLSGNDSSNGNGTIDDLEIELIEMSGDFWKG